MSLETVTNGVVAICLYDEELSKRGLDQSLSPNMAKELIRDALKARGEKPWPDMEVEIFSCDGALLLLGRPAKWSTHCFRFGNIDEIIEAALHCSSVPPSSLIYLDDEYILCVRCDNNNIPSALFEYGDRMPLSSFSEVHLLEHGEVIIRAGALSILREKFGN